MLTEHKVLLERIATALLERESLENDELDALIAGRPLLPNTPTPPAATSDTGRGLVPITDTANA